MTPATEKKTIIQPFLLILSSLGTPVVMLIDERVAIFRFTNDIAFHY